MPEGHSIHRLAAAFNVLKELGPVQASSPQGRFAAGATMIDSCRILRAWAWGKHLFLDFADDGSRTVHIHLGLYGSWRFYMRQDFGLPTHIGAPRQRGEHIADNIYVGAVLTAATGSSRDTEIAIGMERLTAYHGGGETPDYSGKKKAISAFQMGEQWLPEPGLNTRLRLLFDGAAADLSGPTKCEVLDASEVKKILGRLGPDPLIDDSQLRADFITRAKKVRRMIAQVVMDQSIIAGPGNIYRAECLFRCGIHPHRLAANISTRRLGLLWDDLATQMRRGLADGKIITIDDEQRQQLALQMGDKQIVADCNLWPRYFVYQREGDSCWNCGTEIRIELLQGRKNYWCPGCQK